jgi:hypothetical protein
MYVSGEPAGIVAITLIVSRTAVQQAPAQQAHHGRLVTSQAAMALPVA